MGDVSAEVNRTSGAVVSSAIDVHRALGPGLLESAYRRCLARELTMRGHVVRQEVGIAVDYKGEVIADAFRVDLLVDERVVVEIKAVRALEDVHFAQLLTYLRLGRYPVGLLLNFHVPRMIDGVHRRAATEPLRRRKPTIWEELRREP